MSDENTELSAKVDKILERLDLVEDLNLKLENHIHKWDHLLGGAKKIYASKEFWAAVSLGGLSLLQYYNQLPNITPQMTALIGVGYAVLWTLLRTETNAPIDLPSFIGDKKSLDLDKQKHKE